MRTFDVPTTDYWKEVQTIDREETIDVRDPFHYRIATEMPSIADNGIPALSGKPLVIKLEWDERLFIRKSTAPVQLPYPPVQQKAKHKYTNNVPISPRPMSQRLS